MQTKRAARGNNFPLSAASLLPSIQNVWSHQTQKEKEWSVPGCTPSHLLSFIIGILRIPCVCMFLYSMPQRKLMLSFFSTDLDSRERLCLKHRPSRALAACTKYMHLCFIYYVHYEWTSYVIHWSYCRSPHMVLFCDEVYIDSFGRLR